MNVKNFTWLLFLNYCLIFFLVNENSINVVLLLPKGHMTWREKVWGALIKTRHDNVNNIKCIRSQFYYLFLNVTDLLNLFPCKWFKEISIKHCQWLTWRGAFETICLVVIVFVLGDAVLTEAMGSYSRWMTKWGGQETHYFLINARCRCQGGSEGRYRTSPEQMQTGDWIKCPS